MRKLLLFQIVTFCSVALFAQQTEPRAVYLVDGNTDKEIYRAQVTLESFGTDESVVCATNGTKLSLSSMRLNKTAGASTINNGSKRNGVNAVALAFSGSQLSMYNCNIVSHVASADAIAAVGNGSVVVADEPNITTSRDNAACLNVYDGAKATITDARVSTSSLSCPAFLAQRGGTINVTNATGELRGTDSPIAYSSGNINISGGRILTFNSHIATVNGAGKLYMDEVLYYGYKYYGFQLYYNGKDTQNSGTGLLDIKNSTIVIAEGPMFYVTNSSAEVNLEKVKFGFAKNAPLAQIEAGDWGESGNNGGHLTLKATDQKLEGDIEVDAISSVSFEMNDKVSYKGAINSGKNGVASVVMKNGSSWTVTSDSYLESIEFDIPIEKGIKMINSKGHNIYYDASNEANAPLQGKSYPLKGGGSLLTY